MLKKKQNNFCLKKNTLLEEVVLPEQFRKNNFFRKALPEISKFIRKNPSSGILPEELLLPESIRKRFCERLRKTFGNFRKNTSSRKFPEKLLPEVSEEPIMGLPEASAVSPLSPFFSTSPTLVFYPKVTILRFHC